MKRGLWIQPLSEFSCPAWSCPICRHGIVTLVPKSLIYKETVKSRRRIPNEDGWGPEDVEYAFTAWAQCASPSCKQDFAIAGSGGLESSFGPEGEDIWDKYFSANICQPMPDIFEIPQKCPTAVLGELREVFKLFWSHPEACAGRIRVGIECLLDHLRVPMKKKDKRGKFSDLTLHRRIEAFANREPSIAPQLMALKWLGNSGSHYSDVTRTDLLDAFEILEHSLGEIIERRSARVAELTKKLMKKHRS